MLPKSFLSVKHLITSSIAGLTTDFIVDDVVTCTLSDMSFSDIISK